MEVPYEMKSSYLTIQVNTALALLTRAIPHQPMKGTVSPMLNNGCTPTFQIKAFFKFLIVKV